MKGERYSWWAIGLVVLRSLAVLLLLLPLIWLLGAALHPPGALPSAGLWPFPAQPSLAALWRAFALVGLGAMALNSLLVVALATPLTVLVASWAGFALARLPSSIRRRLVAFSVALLLVPDIALWLPRFLVYRQLGWLDSLWVLAAPALMGTSPLFVLLFYRAFRRIPADTYDAARLDGAGVMQSWAFVAMPLVRPTIVVVAALSALVYWGDYLGPLLYLRSPRLATLPIGLQLLAQLGRADWPTLMAGALLVSLPPVLLFLLTQRALGRGVERAEG